MIITILKEMDKTGTRFVLDRVMEMFPEVRTRTPTPSTIGLGNMIEYRQRVKSILTKI